jgi:hypothetical protein
MRPLDVALPLLELDRAAVQLVLAHVQSHLTVCERID